MITIALIGDALFEVDYAGTDVLEFDMNIPASPEGGCLVLPLAFMDANNEDPTCGLLRCLDPYWVDTLDEHPLDRWKKP